MKPSARWSLAIVALHLFSVGDCIRWHMYPNSQKCLREELRKDVLVKGEYAVASVDGQRIDYVVVDTKNHILAQKENIGSGKFTFSVENFDIFEICFMSRRTENSEPVLQEVFVDIKTGVEAKNYETVAEVSNLKPLEINLKRLEDLSQDIVSEFQDMKVRADEMRDTNESTGYRIFYFSLFSMGCLVIFAIWQVIYLRQYFKAKKLIE